MPPALRPTLGTREEAPDAAPRPVGPDPVPPPVTLGWVVCARPPPRVVILLAAAGTSEGCVRVPPSLGVTEVPALRLLIRGTQSGLLTDMVPDARCLAGRALLRGLGGAGRLTAVRAGTRPLNGGAITVTAGAE